MGIFDYQYLDDKKLRGFDTYKYSCVDTSPISKYVSHPFWNWVVEFYPRWLAPNVLTLGGWFLVMGCFLLECYLDYDLSRNSVSSTNAVPDWFWMLAAICTFAGHTMDGTDGKQARRIGASGPTGELFDHGLDSWSTVPFTITIFSVFGHGDFSVSPFRLLCILISVQVVFIVTHWEKYNTAILFLSWGYDASQFGLVAVYLWTYYVGFEWYKFYVFSSYTFAEVFEMGFYLSCFGSLFMSIDNLHKAYNDGTLKQKTLMEGLGPIIPCILLFIVSIAWAALSPSDVIEQDPRMYFFTMGTIFSNIACRLIICQMSSTRAEKWNFLLFLYTISAVMALLIPSHELAILYVISLTVLLSHIHYGVCIVRQLCQHFNIHAFDVSYLQKKK